MTWMITRSLFRHWWKGGRISSKHTVHLILFKIKVLNSFLLIVGGIDMVVSSADVSKSKTKKRHYIYLHVEMFLASIRNNTGTMFLILWDRIFLLAVKEQQLRCSNRRVKITLFVFPLCYNWNLRSVSSDSAELLLESASLIRLFKRLGVINSINLFISEHLDTWKWTKTLNWYWILNEML